MDLQPIGCKKNISQKNMKISLGTSFRGYFDPLKSRGQTNLIFQLNLKPNLGNLKISIPRDKLFGQTFNPL
jgi:hypothetical protein